MSIWAMLTTGALALFMVSVVVGLSVGAILGHISRQVTELLDFETWQGMPPATGVPDGEARDVSWRRQAVGGPHPRVTNR